MLWGPRERSESRFWSGSPLKISSDAVADTALNRNVKMYLAENIHYSFSRYFGFLDDCLEKVMAPHSSTLAWKIPRTEEHGGPQSMSSLRVGHDWAASLWCFTLCIEEGNGNPLQYSCLENPRDGGAWWAAIYGVAQSRTQLKWLSSSSRPLSV